MKLFPTDWQGFLTQLAAWGELSITARRTFLDGAAPGLSFLPAAGDPAVTELRDAGLLEESGGPGSLGISKRYVPFHQVVKSLEKYPLFESPGLAALCAYLGEHYSRQERSHLHESLALLPNDLPRIAGLVSSLEWLQTALARRGRQSQESGWETAQILLSFFTEQRDRIAVRDLEEYFPAVDRDELCAAARLGLQRAVFFLGLRRADLEPLLGVWPAAGRRLRRLSVVLAPEPVSVNNVFLHPFLVEDMTTLLVSACSAPIPLRREDEKPFARFREETAAMLLSLPEWLERLTGLSMEGRIDLAFQALRLCGLLVPSGAGPGAPLVPAPVGARWIRQPLDERHSFLVSELVATPLRPSRLFDLMEEEVSSADGAREEVLPWLLQAFSHVPLTTFIRFADFAEYQAAIGSPLLASGAVTESGRPDLHGAGASSPLATEEALEELWKSFLGIFFGRCLLALGGAEAGVTTEEKPGFRVTDVGRTLLGLRHDGALDPDETVSQGSPALIVQPSFEVVFFSPSPGFEAALGRYCERVGREVGVLFRITRQSLRRARAAGIDAEQVLRELALGSRSALPLNVEHEIRGWMGGENE